MALDAATLALTAAELKATLTDAKIAKLFVLSRLSTNRAHKTSPSTCQFFNSMLFIFCRLCYDTDR